MLEYIRSLFRHQAWADDELLKAVTACEPARTDAAMLHALHHMATVQLFLLSRLKEEIFDMARFKEQPAFEVLLERFREAHEAQEVYLQAITEADLQRAFAMPFFKADFTLLEGMTQIILHSQNHRGQCLTRLRELGAKPPTLDYILWVRDAQARPAGVPG
ncbi:hypothetical protein DYQ86_25245 [Acidobacteria bacterium AB60]|nr:hypothetical protein DYQ86_25245 [Acidobacteria bacterium AB60]